MRLLLDTNVLLWIAAADRRVVHLQERITDPTNEVFVSAATYWEIAIKVGLCKLAVDLVSLRQTAARSGYTELPVLGIHTEQLVHLPSIHKAPFGRLLLAQAISEPMRLLTSDRVLAGYGAHVEVICCVDGLAQPALSRLSSNDNERLRLPRAARVSKRTRASWLASAIVASSSISWATPMEFDFARAYSRSCLSSDKRIVKVDMERQPGATAPRIGSYRRWSSCSGWQRWYPDRVCT